jgi:hypothetical protein
MRANATTAVFILRKNDSKFRVFLHAFADQLSVRFGLQH